MPDESQLNPAEQELELHLAGLRPAQHSIQRDIVFFRAGQRAALRRLRAWQAASSVILLATVGFWWWRPSLQPSPEPFQVAAQDRRDRPPQSAASLPQALPAKVPLRAPGTREYLLLRAEVVAKGLEVLPAPPLTPTASDGVEAVSDWRSFAALTSSTAPRPAVQP